MTSKFDISIDIGIEFFASYENKKVIILYLFSDQSLVTLTESIESCVQSVQSAAVAYCILGPL